MNAFGADVLIYVAVDHENGGTVRRLFDDTDPGEIVGVGSVILIPELLSKPQRDSAAEQLAQLEGLLARLDLHPTDETTARLAAALGARYRLRAADAVHLATAVAAGADRFITNNRSDFTSEISEIDIVYPDQLAAE